MCVVLLSVRDAHNIDCHCSVDLFFATGIDECRAKSNGRIGSLYGVVAVQAPVDAVTLAAGEWHIVWTRFEIWAQSPQQIIIGAWVVRHLESTGHLLPVIEPRNLSQRRGLAQVCHFVRLHRRTSSSHRGVAL